MAAPRARATDLPPVSFHRLSTGREVLLPTADPRGFHEYLGRLRDVGTFAPAAVDKLAGVGATPALPPRPDQVVIGVLLSEPEGLLPGTTRSAEALIQWLDQAGARVVLIPPRADVLLPSSPAARKAGIDAMVGALDGVVGPGGADVHPKIYAQQQRHAVDPNYPRDRFEADFALAALASDVFMLGICRSHQLWNAARGGTLVQDLAAEGNVSVTHDQTRVGLPLSAAYEKDGYRHTVEIERGSRLHAVLGATSMVTNSFHHQAVERPGAGLAVSAVAVDPVTGTRTIEATEAENAITVQWHPELRRPAARDEALLATLLARATIFHYLREEVAAGRPPSAKALLARMASSRQAFSRADHEWVRTELARRLAAKAL